MVNLCGLHDLSLPNTVIYVLMHSLGGSGLWQHVIYGRSRNGHCINYLFMHTLYNDDMDPHLLTEDYNTMSDNRLSIAIT